ncbi:2-dehydropantoate 2-reductase [Bacillus sp. FJAT-45037]|uniref:2-dehydropantoate 2-reductase n=1 Tax=Bacillus sp. FJAT-45037 TaxID=2011007 RepID=UPI000C23707B|nr:2-dehydropantoate 2-reductase [Bacillus sp. FJAT-45037]
MNVHIIGAGAIGLLVAYYMRKSNQEVTLVTRTQEQANQIKKDGIVLESKRHLRDYVACHAITFDELPSEKTEVLCVTVKSYQLEPILDFIQKEDLIYEAIMFLSNGMGHVPLIEKFQSKAEVCVGVVEHGAKRQNANTVYHTGVGRIRWANVTNAKGVFLHLSRNIHDSCFPLTRHDKWLDMLEEKLIVNVCINPLTALLDTENGVLIVNSHYRLLMKQVFSEVIGILERKKDQEYLWSLVCAICNKTSRNQSSMLVDIKQNRQTEIDSMTGYLIKRAEAVGSQVPTVQFLHEAIKGKEKGGEKN